MVRESRDGTGGDMDEFTAIEKAWIASTCIHAWQEPAGMLLRPLRVGDLTHPIGTSLQGWAPTVRALLDREGTS